MVDGIVGVLGANGFIGSNLMYTLSANNIKCVGASRRNGVDATKLNSLLDWIKKYDICHIVNLAAECGGIGLNQQEPANLWASTTSISHTVLEASILANIQKVVMIGSVCSYGADTPVPFKETDLMCYGNPEKTNAFYGIAKLNALFGAIAYSKQYNLNVTCLIPVNTYGPYDHFNINTSHVIPAFIKKFIDAVDSNMDSVVLWGDGTPTREFIHATDLSRAIMNAIYIPNTNEFINIGSGYEISMTELSTLIAKLVGYNGDIKWDTTNPNGQMRRCLNIDRAKSLLNFTPSINLQTGLLDTIAWYRQNKT
jgi:GDP-L-fucose synthase